MAARQECVCKVRAQVMARDQGTGLWCPLHGGGMSIVELSRAGAPAGRSDVTDDREHGHGDDDETYYIIGHKETDLVLFCVVSEDLTYTRATPTFHHWQTGNCSNGLTFQSPSEADTFAKAVYQSVEVIRHEYCPGEKLLPCHAEDFIAENTHKAKTFTIAAEVESRPAEHDSEAAVVDLNLASSSPPEQPELPADREEEANISLSELEQVLPKLPPKLSQVPPRPTNRPRPICSQSFSAAPPRPPAVKQLHRTQSSVSDAGLPPIPPRAPRTLTSVTRDAQSTLFSLQQSPSITSSSNVVVPHAASLVAQSSPDPGVLGTTLNYVYFTEGAAPPATPLVVVPKRTKHKPPPDASHLGRRHADIGKKLADSGLGTVNVPSYCASDDNHPAGPYVRLAMTSQTATVDPVSLHDYCYPSIDAVVPAPTPASLRRMEPQRTPPPLPTSRRIGWWDCRWRRRHPRCSRLRATWTQRPTTYGTESSVVESRVSLDNSQTSSLAARRPLPPWRSRLWYIVMRCVHPCRWRHRCHQRRCSGPVRVTESST